MLRIFTSAASYIIVANSLLSKATLKIARELLDRFYRDAEGKTNRQLDVYFTIEDLALGQERAAPAVEFLISRGLIKQYGADVAFLTDKGVRIAVDDIDLAGLPKEIRDFEQAPSQPQRDPYHAPRPDTFHDRVAMAPAPTPAAAGYAEGPRTSRTGQPLDAEPAGAPDGSPRPERATLTHIALDGEEFALELGSTCTIGRADGNTIQINDKRASKSHAEILYEAGEFVLRDLESANGTLLNGEYVVNPVVLRHDDEVVIGRTMLLYTAPVMLPPPAEPAPFEPPPQHPAEPFRVIQGIPAPDRPPTGSGFASPAGGFSIGAPTADLDVPHAPTERPSRASSLGATPGGADLFAEPPRSSDPAFYDGSQGAGASAGRDPGLFGEAPTHNIFDQPPAGAPPEDPDLFSDPSSFNPSSFNPSSFNPSSGGPPATYGQPPHQHPPPSTADTGPELVVTPLAEGLQASLQERRHEVQALEALDDPSRPDWAGDTFAEPAPLLENQPVIRPAGMPEAMPEGATLAQPKTDDIQTLMVSREDLFGHGSDRIDPADPPRWGDGAGVHPTFGAEPTHLGAPSTDPIHRLRAFAEDLPVADLEMASWRPPMAPQASPGRKSMHGAPTPTPTPEERRVFFTTLQVLQHRLQEVDVPEKRALLEAIEVLTQHPFVRAVVESAD